MKYYANSFSYSECHIPYVRALFKARTNIYPVGCMSFRQENAEPESFSYSGGIKVLGNRKM